MRIYAALTFALCLAASPTPGASGPESRRDARPSNERAHTDGTSVAAYRGLVNAFMNALGETHDVQAALDAVLTDGALVRFFTEAASHVDVDSEEVRGALERASSQSSPELAPAYRDMLAMTRLLPVFDASNRAARAATGGERDEQRDPATAMGTLINAVYDPTIPVSIAAGCLGIVQGPLAMALHEVVGDDLSEEHGRDLATIANEGTHDGLRLIVSFVEAAGVMVPDDVLPHADRFNLKAEAARHNERRFEGVVGELLS